MKTVKHNSAFSLVEVMCALLILGIGIVGLTQGLSAALQSSKEAEIQTNAALIAAGRIETLRADGYLVAGETEGELGGGLSSFKWKETISETDLDGLFEVSVVVQNSDTDATLFELKTLLFDEPYTTSTNTTSKASDNKRKEGRKR